MTELPQHRPEGEEPDHRRVDDAGNCTACGHQVDDHDGIGCHVEAPESTPDVPAECHCNFTDEALRQPLEEILEQVAAEQQAAES